MESSLLKSRASFLNQASKNVSSAPKPPKAKKEVKKKKNPESGERKPLHRVYVCFLCMVAYVHVW